MTYKNVGSTRTSMRMSWRGWPACEETSMAAEMCKVARLSAPARGCGSAGWLNVVLHLGCCRRRYAGILAWQPICVRTRWRVFRQPDTDIDDLYSWPGKHCVTFRDGIDGLEEWLRRDEMMAVAAWRKIDENQRAHEHSDVEVYRWLPWRNRDADSLMQSCIERYLLCCHYRRLGQSDQCWRLPIIRCVRDMLYCRHQRLREVATIVSCWREETSILMALLTIWWLRECRRRLVRPGWPSNTIARAVGSIRYVARICSTWRIGGNL